MQTRWYDPRPDQLSYPADPTFVLLAALMTITLELPEETPRYFAAAATAQWFYREWSETAPKGAHWGLVGNEGLPRPVRDGAVVPFAVQSSMPAGQLHPVTVRGRIWFVKQGNRYRIKETTVQ